MRIRTGATIALGLVVTVLTAGPALAHVTVDPTQANRGDTVDLVFSVPNEKTDVDTVKVEIQFSSDHPIASVSVKPKPGWNVHVTTAPLKSPLQTAHGQVTQTVSDVIWDGGTIAPGQFDDFEVQAGPLPSDVQTLVFPTTQTYADGSEVQWSQQTFEGQAAPANPAPQLGVAGEKKSNKSSTSTTQIVAVAALVLAIAGVVIGGMAYINVRRWR